MAGAAAVLLAVGAALAVRAWAFGYSVIDWDESVYLVIAQRWLAGDLPYVDIWDLHPVGLPALFAAIDHVTTDTILAVRATAAVAVGLTAAIIGSIARRTFHDPVAAATAGLLYILSVSGIVGAPANTELFNNLLIASGSALLLQTLQERRPGRMGAVAVLLVGLAFGAALQIKLQVAPQVLALSGLFMWVDATVRGWAAAARRAALLAIAGAVPTLAVVAYYAAQGELGAMLYANFGASLHYAAQGAPPDELGPRLVTGAKALLAPAIGAALLLASLRRARADAPLAILWILAWLGGGLLDVLAPLKFWPHYFLVLAPPLCLMAGGGVSALGHQAGRRMGLVAAAVLFAITGALDLRDAAIFRTRAAPDVPRLVAARILYDGGASDGLFVFDYQPVIYQLTNARPPSRFVLPVELGAYTPTSGADGHAEVARILAARPRYIVTSDPPVAAMPPAIRSALAQALGQYELVARHQGGGPVPHGASLYRRRATQPGAQSDAH